MKTYAVLNRLTYEVIHAGEANSRREIILQAVALGKSLARAKLTDAKLARADLTGADLTDAKLARANLTGANLTDAKLTGADLTGADLTGANLTGADLTGANLTDAKLARANLTGADLTGADLTGANLTGADLTDANLTGAKLTGANLTGANLTPIRDDFFNVICKAPNEIPALREALMSGKVDGSTYVGVCKCLVGTIAGAQGKPYDCVPGITPDASRPAERFFLAIQKGDTPETSQFASRAVAWIDEFEAMIAKQVEVLREDQS